MASSFLHATLAILLISSIFRAKAQINTPCSSSMISTFTPCLNYVTGSSGTVAGSTSPTQDCCDSLKSLMTYNMDCICFIVTGNVPVSIPFINATLAISCKNSVSLQCKATGAPLPTPGPVLFGPTPAPAPARGPAPTGPVSLGPAPSPAPARTTAPPHSHSSKASKSAKAAAAVPPPAEILNAAPVARANPGIRPVVNNPNSASSSPYTVQLLYLVLIMYVGIMAFHLV